MTKDFDFHTEQFGKLAINGFHGFVQQGLYNGVVIVCSYHVEHVMYNFFFSFESGEVTKM